MKSKIHVVFFYCDKSVGGSCEDTQLSQKLISIILVFETLTSQSISLTNN